MDRAGHGLLPGAVRPRQDQGIDRPGVARDRLAQRARGRAVPDEGAVHAPPGLGQELLRHGQLALELGVAARELPLQALHRQVRVDARHDLFRLEGLGDEVHGPGLEAAHLLPRVLERGEEDDGRVGGRGVALQPAAGLVAVHPRHQDVEQDERRPRAQRHAESVLAARRHQELVAVPVERLPEEVEVGGVVVDQQDAVGVGSGHTGSIVDGRSPQERASAKEHRAWSRCAGEDLCWPPRSPFSPSPSRRRPPSGWWTARSGTISRTACAPTSARWCRPSSCGRPTRSAA